MSLFGLRYAIQYGERLKGFKSSAAAERYLFSCRDHLLRRLEKICKRHPAFSPSYTVESLKQIEKWYFDLCDKNGFRLVGSTQDEFESILSVYFGEVVVRNKSDARWVITEYPFSPQKYELMVNRGLFSMSILEKFHGLSTKPNNKRRNLMFREYNRFFGK